MSDIERHHGNGRMSQITCHQQTVYLAGQVAAPGESVAEQTAQILAKIDALLAEVGSEKSKILQAIIWLSSMDDFAEMNGVWDAWVPAGNEPCRACGEAALATPDYKVEIIVTAAR